MSTNRFKLEEPVERNIDVTFIGQIKPVLSRRKARKLAYRYKGSSLGERYRAYLAGDLVGFEVNGKRLERVMKILRRRTLALHTTVTAERTRRQTAIA